MTRALDLWSRVLPPWAQSLCPASIPLPSHSLCCITEAQALHLGFFTAVPSLVRFVSLAPPFDWCQACMLQSRPHTYFHARRGEPFDFPIHGTHFTVHGEPLQILGLPPLGGETHRFPFWLTREECIHLSDLLPDVFGGHVSLEEKFRKMSYSARLAEDGVYHESARYQLTVVNVEEVLVNPTITPLLPLLSLFRRFQPLHVLTRLPFPPVVELHIRSHCWRMGCWCSIWGTIDDFKQLGMNCYPNSSSGLPLHIPDSGSTFLSAISSSDPQRVYQRVITDRHTTQL